MKIVTHVDRRGRKTLVEVPDRATENTWGQGIVIGPPDLSSLGLGEDLTTRLHNELYHRGIIRRTDARRNRAEVHAALMSALRVDADYVINLFEEHANA